MNALLALVNLMIFPGGLFLLAGGLAYSAGVVLSFVALAALLLALRAGGE